MRKQYDEATFTVFESWLEQYVCGWGDCDDFCTHAFGELICQNTELSKKTVLWAQRDEFWMRRASARVSYRYALEKMSGEKRKFLMQ